MKNSPDAASLTAPRQATSPEMHLSPLRLLLFCAVCACARTTPRPIVLDVPAPAPLTFDGVSGAQANAPGLASALFATRWYRHDQNGSVRVQPLVRQGGDIGSTPFGALVGPRGELIESTTGERPWFPEAIDFNALHEVNGELEFWSHIEARPAALYRTQITLDDKGTLHSEATRPIDLTAVGGSKDLCAGDVTPWGSHLAAEEYETPAEQVLEDGTLPPSESIYDAEYNGMTQVLGPGREHLWPYDYGWMVEITPDGGGTQVTKHHAMGRFSHEIGVVMPDRRTVYMSDDQTRGGGLFMFVADRPDRLDAGTLYALRWKEPTSTTSPVDWVSLGHASDLELRDIVRKRELRFHDMFEVTSPPCEAPAKAVRTGMRTECLRLKEGMAAVASRFETRRYAGLVGATTEFTKGEGLAFDPAQRVLYLAISTVIAPMHDDQGHLQLPENRCGAIYALDQMHDGVNDSDGKPIRSAFVATQAREALSGAEGDEANNPCRTDAISGPDNVAFLPGGDLLTIAEDTSGHKYNVLWGWQPSTGELQRIAIAPECGEWSGIRWFPDTAGFSWLTLSLQHGFAYKDCVAEGIDPTPPISVRNWAGVLGPFPTLRTRE